MSTLLANNTATPIYYESHMHTPLCNHAIGSPEEYAAVAQQRGLKGIIVTCHNPIPDGWSARLRMSIDQFDDYVAMVAKARAIWQGRIDVRLGMESDYVPGMEPWLEQLHRRAEFHHILGSVHPQLPEYTVRYLNGDPLAFQQTYFEHLAMAAETGLFDTLSHPDLVKIMFPHTWNPDLLMDTICRSLDRIAATGVAMELNTSGIHKAYPEMNPGKTILAEIHRRNIPIVIGADAHEPQRVAANFEEALQTLKETGFTQVHYFINRQQHALDIEAVLASLIPLDTNITG